MTTTNPIADTPPSSETLSFGAALRAAREQRGLNAAAVARQLNLPERTVEALEAEAFDRLPETPFVRGYIGSYARFLGIDAKPLEAAFAKVCPAGPGLGLTTPTATAATPTKLPGFGILSIVLIGSLLALSAFWLVSREDQVAAVPSETPAERQATAEAEREAEVDAIARSVAQNVQRQQQAAAELEANSPAVAALPQTTPATPATPSNPPEPAPTTSDVPQSASNTDANPPENPPAPASEPSTAQAPAAAEPEPEPVPEDDANAIAEGDVLELVTPDKSWVEVRDSSRKRLMFAMLNAGEPARLVGQAPFQVFLGNAPVVEIQVNGRTVAVPPSGRKRTLRFTVESDSTVR